MPFPLNAPHSRYFYVARNAIYHLFGALRLAKHQTVLVPDYHSGNEVSAIRAAGAKIQFYKIRRNLEPDLKDLIQLCDRNTRVLYLIHFIGWPQPLDDLLAIARERNLIVVEDCALSLLSESGARPLGSAGDYSVYCLYKTLPVPNGGLLIQNRAPLPELDRLELRDCSVASVCGRIADLTVERIRSRYYRAGTALSLLKRSAGQLLSTLRVNRIPVGDIGFDLSRVNIGMSKVSHHLLKRFDYEWIRKRRRENFLLMRQRLTGKATFLRQDLPEGVCPLFFPILVPRKHAAAEALLEHGINTVEFWNYGDPEAARLPSSDASFLRDHVLELPIHQDVSLEQVEYIANQVVKLKLRL